MRRSPIEAAFLLSALTAVGVSTACSGTVSVAPVTFTPYGSCDTIDGVALITGVSDYSTYCPGLDCMGSYYALCNGAAWDSCACGIPSGDSEIAWSGYGPGVVDGGSISAPEAGDESSMGNEGGGATEDVGDGGGATEDSDDGSFGGGGDF
jgi:hypothetical protein